MVSSSGSISTEDRIATTEDRARFDACRAKVDWFVARHFTWSGTLALHGVALGGDILRAPVNVMLSPVFVLTRMLAFLCRWTGLPAVANWLFARRILLRTAVARRVELCILTDILDLPLPRGPAAHDPHVLLHVVLAAPQFRDLIRKRESAAEAQALGLRIAGALGDYAGTRSAVAEMTTVLVTLAVGVTLFQALTPGMISMAPGVAEVVAQTRAVSDFPLGETIGGMWYGMFPTGASPWLVAATTAILVMIGSTFAAFAGVLADPVQSRLGIHRRRLMRLIDSLEAELCGPRDKPFAASEHYYARLLDLWDVGAGAFRIFRN